MSWLRTALGRCGCPGVVVSTEESGPMKADMGRRYRLYPTPRQAKRLTGWGHTCRAVWNVALAQRQFGYAQPGTRLRAAGQCRHLTEARAELDWLANLPAQSAQQVLAHLDRADDNWWDPEHPAGPPRFNKRRHGLSVPFPGQAVAVRTLNNRWAQVRPPKLGWVQFRLSRPLGGVVRNATVSRDALGWHVAFGVATGARPVAPNGLPGCGVDFGVACSAYVSTETAPRLMPPTLTEGERRRLLGLERRKARQVRWAKPYNRGLFGPAAPHHCGDRPAPGAAGAPSGRLHPQAHHRPRSTPRLGRDRGPAGDGHDCQRQGHHRAAWEQREGQGWTQPGRVGQHPGRAAPPAGRQGARVRVGAVAGAASGHLGDVRVMRPPGPGVPARVWESVRCTGCGHQAHADANAARNIEQLAAGRAVGSTRSHPRVARPASSRMREPLGSAA
jgi:putative transposase